MVFSDLIQLIGVLVALGVGIVSVLISIKTLKQNSKMIEESTRPYVVIYYEMTNLGQQEGYFVIKNFGNTGASIDKFEYSDCLNNLQFRFWRLKEQFQTIKGLYLAPQQKVLIKLSTVPKEFETASFTIGYYSTTSKYEETFVINMQIVAQHLSLRSDGNINSNEPEIKLPKVVTYGIQEMIERKL